MLPGLRALMQESPGIRVDTSFKMMVQSVIQDMKNNNVPEKEATPSTNLPKIPEPNPSNAADNNNNNAIGGNNDGNTGGNAPSSNTSAADKGSTRRNIFGKLDAAVMEAASITNSLKVDFDKAIPKWTWKNK